MKRISNQRIVSAYTIRYEKKSGLDIQIGESSCKAPRTVAEIFTRIYESTDSVIQAKEYCFALLLNRINRPVGYIKVAEGGVGECSLDNRLVLKAALDLNATGVILCHNHPSGSPYPGSSDLKQTDSLRKALNTLDINLLDHIILTDGQFYSFADSCAAQLNK